MWKLDVFTCTLVHGCEDKGNLEPRLSIEIKDEVGMNALTSIRLRRYGNIVKSDNIELDHMCLRYLASHF